MVEYLSYPPDFAIRLIVLFEHASRRISWRVWIYLVFSFVCDSEKSDKSKKSAFRRFRSYPAGVGETDGTGVGVASTMMLVWRMPMIFHFPEVLTSTTS